MKKIMTVILGVLMSGMIMAGVVSAHAGEDHTAAAASQTQVHEGSLYQANDSVVINGVVHGDVYCAGNSVIVDATVEGDVICAGQSVTVSGDVAGDVRVAGQLIDIEANIGGSLSAFGQIVTVAESAVVGRDFNGAAQTVKLAGEVKRDVLIGAETMIVAGSVGRNLGGEYEQLTIENSAAVVGSLNYASPNQASIAEGSVQGEINRTEREPRNDGGDAGAVLAGLLTAGLALLLVSLVLALLLPRLVQSVSEQGRTRFWHSLAVGFLVLFGAPIVIVTLALTVIGLPLAGLLLLVWLLLLSLSGPMFGYLVGRWLLSGRSAHVVVTMLAGSLLLLMTYVIPLVNGLTLLLAGTVGSGMIVLALAQRFKKPNYRIKKT